MVKKNQAHVLCTGVSTTSSERGKTHSAARVRASPADSSGQRRRVANLCHRVTQSVPVRSKRWSRLSRDYQPASPEASCLYKNKDDQGGRWKQPRQTN